LDIKGFSIKCNAGSYLLKIRRAAYKYLGRRKIKSVIYLDLDGVLADFERKAQEVLGDCWREEIENDGWGKFAQHPRIFSTLPVMHGANELYEFCCNLTGDKNRVQLLTALPSRVDFREAARDKIEWARKHIDKHVRVNFGPYAKDKQYHCRIGDILIDDMEINILQWRDRGGHAILHIDAASSIVQLVEQYKEK
jgi:hypothetical protein